MNVRCAATLGLGLLLGGCAEPPPPEQGFAGLGRESAGFAAVVPGASLEFPADHGAHPDFRIEWWYVTANLSDAQGREYGVQWTLFRHALRPGADHRGWENGNLFLGHAGVTGEEVHRAAERLARGGVGQAGVEVDPLRAWIDDWTLGGDPETGMQVHARGADFVYTLRLEPQGPLVLQGERGYSRKSAGGQASYYYSHPFLQATGTLELDGRRIEVRGPAWMDREWSSQPLAGDQQGWDWFSLRLDDGSRLMAFQLRHAGGARYLSGTWITADGEASALDGHLIALEPVAHTRVAGRQVPTVWRLAVRGRLAGVEVRALNPRAWMDLGTPYWEGPVRVAGAAHGVGYLEMTGY